MTMKPNLANERVKRDYFRWLKEANGRDGATVDGVAASLARFERSTKARDFKRFHREQAVAFKRELATSTNPRTGKPISKATMHTILRDLRAFFGWLSREPGFRQSLNYTDADYFNLSDKDVTVARARRDKRAPILAQVEHVLSAMPGGTITERRDRALIAFTMLTGARVGALASFRLGDVDLASGRVEHDARHVRSKFAKTFSTFFMPVSDRAAAIVGDWHRELSADVARGPDTPLFPATAIGLDDQGAFAPAGLSRDGWSGTGPVREVFRRGFAVASLAYFNPHSFRDMLVHHAMTLDLSPEAMKAWSQNLGHADVLTTFTSYGQVATHRQGELIRAANLSRESLASREQIATLETLLAGLKAGTSTHGGVTGVN